MAKVYTQTRVANASKMFSTYYYGLEEIAKQRYRQKVERAGLVDDPYVTLEQRIQSEDWQNWPRIEYPDIYNYLIQTPSIYTGESLRAYKSLDGYNFFLNGWVSNVSVTAAMCTPDIKLVWFCETLTEDLGYSSEAMGCC